MFTYRIDIATEGGYYLFMAYSPTHIARIKSLPYHARSWMPDNKAWWIDADYLEELQQLLGGQDVGSGRRHPPGRGSGRGYDRRRGSDRDAGARDPAPRSDCPFAALHLRPDAPLPVVKAAYGALAKLHHPDVGGDEERMKAINLAYEMASKSASR